MKKIVFILSLITTIAFAQKTYVTGSASVYVSPKTLVYNGSGLDVTAGTASVTNKGNIIVNSGTFATTNNGTNDNVRMVYTDNGGTANADGSAGTSGYGQLIVRNGVTTPTGKVDMDKMMPAAASFTYNQAGFPFQSTTSISTLTSDFGITMFDAARASHPVFVWNNDKIQWDRAMAADMLDPFKYYIVAKKGAFSGYMTGAVREHKGAVNNANATIAFSTSQPTGDISASNRRNDYNERYITYVDDAFQATKTASDWGRNMLQLANPYTSNIDLSYIGFAETATLNGVALNDGNNISNLVGVYRYSTATFSGTSGSTVYGYTQTILKATAAAGKFVAGDAPVLLIRPFESFIVKTSSASGNFVFGDGLKVFNYKARVTDNAAGTGTIAYRDTSTANKFYQVGVNLFKNDEVTGNRTYVVANDNIQNGFDAFQLEAVNYELGDATGFYTKEELASGNGEDPAHSDVNLYINSVNTAYLGVPIPLHFNVNTADAGATFKIKFTLDDTLVRLSQAGSNFDNPNARYYFRDNQENVTMLINSDTEYTFTQGSTTDTRFQLFYGSPTSMGTGEISTDLAGTILYKDNDRNYLVRFDNSWEKANITIHTAVGQIVFTKKDIDATQDYMLPLQGKASNAVAYFVTIENAVTGEKVSKKIVK